MEEKTAAKKRSTGNYFAIDQAQFHKAVAKGLNEAIAFLILARGSDKKNIKTQWSVNAVEHYGGIGRSRAHTAIKALIAAGLVKQTRVGKRPSYNMVLTKEPKRVWLPNTLIDGTIKQEKPPIVKLRETGEVGPLHLFIDLYSCQDLAEDGGIPRTVFYHNYKRVSAGYADKYQIWGFVREGVTHALPHEVTKPHWTKRKGESEDPIWKHLTTLQWLGLVEETTNLYESSEDTSELIHVYGDRLKLEEKVGAGEELTSLESLESLGLLAHAAAVGMISLEQGARACVELSTTEDLLHLAPIERHFSDPTMVTTYRLYYRPKTAKTSKWMATLGKKKALYTRRYTDLYRKYSPNLERKVAMEAA